MSLTSDDNYKEPNNDIYYYYLNWLLQVLFMAHGVLDLHCSMQNLLSCSMRDL